MWRAVEIMRTVETELKTFQSTTYGKPKLIATHGNRFVLHMAFHSNLDPNNADLEATRKAIPDVVKMILIGLISATMKLYDSSYPSNLFKNLSKCKELAKEMEFLS